MIYEVPLEELKEKLSSYDEVTLLELLDLNSNQLVNLLEDVIEEKYDELLSKISDEEEED